MFEDVKLPDGKVLIPGVLDSTTNYIEHPELVAQRIVRYAQARRPRERDRRQRLRVRDVRELPDGRSRYHLGQAARDGRGRRAGLEGALLTGRYIF